MLPPDHPRAASSAVEPPSSLPRSRAPLFRARSVAQPRALSETALEAHAEAAAPLRVLPGVGSVDMGARQVLVTEDLRQCLGRGDPLEIGGVACVVGLAGEWTAATLPLAAPYPGASVSGAPPRCFAMPIAAR